ncbi:hypothetical protein CPC16_006113, partial [Podila verticillata]
MKLQTSLYIAIATAIALTASLTEAMGDQRDIVADEAYFSQDAAAELADHITHLWKTKQHRQRRHRTRVQDRETSLQLKKT